MKNSHMFVEIVNADPDLPYFKEIQMINPIVNDEYSFEDIKLSSDYEAGDYIRYTYGMMSGMS